MAERLTDEQLDRAEGVRAVLNGVCYDAYSALRYIDEEGDHDDLEALEEALAVAEEAETELHHATTELQWLIDEMKKARKPGPRGGETP